MQKNKVNNVVVKHVLSDANSKMKTKPDDLYACERVGHGQCACYSKL